MITSQFKNESVPDVDAITPQVYKALHQAINSKLMRSCHDLSEGGLAIAAAEMCIGGCLGLDLVSHQTPRSLFGETTGCLLVEVSPENVAAFESIFDNLPFAKIGTVIAEPILKFDDVEISVDELVQAFIYHSS